MKEVEHDKQFPVSFEPVSEEAAILGTIRDILMLQTGLLMRLYDLQMALLNSVDEETADEVNDAHKAGSHFNPPVMVPVFQEVDDE